MNVQRSALLPYSASQIYQVISDVRSYPEFLNWCEAESIESENEGLQLATLHVSYGKLKLSFSTQNTMVVDQSIDMQLSSGPFKALSGQWLITALDESACKVFLEMDFKFSNPITHKLFGKVFQSVVSAQIDAFEKRAHTIFGTSNA